MAGARFPALALLAILSSAAASRASNNAYGLQEDGSATVRDDAGPANKAYKVDLLVTRHGLSCSNMVEKWISYLDVGRGTMLDPALTGLAQHGAQKARADVAAWLQVRNRSVDALLSSVLLRAMETGLLTYTQAGPLYVVPYIREHSSGNSNNPDSHEEQVRRLLGSIPGRFQVDYRWTNAFGTEKGSWSEFLRFLEQSFLPELTRELPPRTGPITLAVVTHSLYMRDSDVGARCKSLWTSQGADKPLNNQVVRLAYTFSTQLPAPKDVEVTPKHVLVPMGAEKCEQVSAGQNVNDKVLPELCFADIGPACVREIASHAYFSGTLWKQTIESKIVVLAGQIEDSERHFKEVEDKLLTLTDTGKKIDQKLQDAFVDEKLALFNKRGLLDKLKRTPCPFGGQPDALTYADVMKLRLSARVKTIVVEGGGALLPREAQEEEGPEGER